MLPFMHSLESALKELNDRIGLQLPHWPIFVLGSCILAVSYLFMPAQVTLAFSIALFLAPVWLPFLIYKAGEYLWYTHKRAEFIASKTYLLLEVKPPRNIVKTPLAMETFLTSLHLTGGESTWWQRFMGGIRANWSLEIASFEGQVHFFIWTRAEFRRLVESQIYAQYPGCQVSEVPDYTRQISAAAPDWGVWGCDFKHTAEAPLPIKTYVEYGLDETQKEPEQVDPLANLLEFMASIGKGEYLWLQFVIRAHRGEKYGAHPGAIESYIKNAKGKGVTWRDEGENLVKQIRAETVTKQTYRDVVSGEIREFEGFPNPTKGQSEKMAAIERNTSKLAFDVGVRGIYIAKPEHFHGPTIAHLIALFKPFTSAGWNGIDSTAWLKRFNDYPWEFGAEKRKDEFREQLVEQYRRRQFFYEPFYEGNLELRDLMVMSTEELATIYHLPSAAIQTPTVPRIQSTTSEAPANLPT